MISKSPYGRRKTMKLLSKVDIHVHTTLTKPFDGAFPSYASYSELIGMYDELNIEYGVLLPEIAPECGQRLSSNEEIMEVVSRCPDRFGWFMNIDPRALSNSPDTDFSPLMDYYKSKGAKGLGEMCCSLAFDDPRSMNLYAQCEKKELPVIFHIGFPERDYGMIDDLGLPRLETVLRTFPKLRILGHSQKFWAEISGGLTAEERGGYPTVPVRPGGRLVELMDKYPNLCCDISAGSGFNALSRDPRFGCEFLERYQDRVFFGTDICRPGQIVHQGEWLDEMVQTGGISYLCYEKVCRENANRLLNR